MIVLPYLAHEPRIGSRLNSHPSGAIIGRTRLGADCALGELALVRGDGEDVQIGADCWFGEASTVHIADRLLPAVIGSHVTVARFGLVHACTVGDDCVVGEHAAVMDGSVLGPGTVIAAQSVVPPGKTLEGGWLYAGAPARPVCVAAGSITEPGTEVAAGQVWSGRPARQARPLSERNRQEFARAVQVYVGYAGNYLLAERQFDRPRAASLSIDDGPRNE